MYDYSSRELPFQCKSDKYSRWIDISTEGEFQSVLMSCLGDVRRLTEIQASLMKEGFGCADIQSNRLECRTLRHKIGNNTYRAYKIVFLGDPVTDVEVGKFEGFGLFRKCSQCDTIPYCRCIGEENW